ncbi:hypothetical protein HanRHA438_Chr12g0533531 [Helianthus annuus]|uniref:Uncharacterized protein n=1 Tax=Helianthus annuus TaxID=4232 RepID=A0A251UV40_HELAN|nr:hypothetical protein HanXRQr2_Chr12g0521961 [Helianthus annuus]KAJ0487977.1 hypothetical protein HanHA300_Chr12g0427971 [Helianthus annuus]KAJ0503785.1 hypothetical protein HanHA89_Chr12g0452211 [Helianthus annuus]KAJ0676823.1 hypothetical protein HanOQP8_Chr12g0430261 [Helianthus annuus]KAJ0864778.1 hypothetical protein HanRHA438_Chr12g0533531 [Helianthus annuus]
MSIFRTDLTLCLCRSRTRTTGYRFRSMRRTRYTNIHGRKRNGEIESCTRTV